MIKPNPTLLQYIDTFLRKLHAINEEQLSGHFSEINHLSEKSTLTYDRRRTMDKSALEKLRCLPAGRAKKLTKSKLRQIEVGSNISQNHSSKCPCDQKPSTLPLDYGARHESLVEPIQTLLKITSLNHRKSYLIIMYHNSHEKLTKSKIR